MYKDYLKGGIAGAPDVSAPAALQWVSSGQNPIFVDVRGEAERGVSVIPGSLSQGEFEEQLERGDVAADRKVVAYCTIGYRSGKYVLALRSRGIPAYNLAGSVLAWVHAGGQVQTPGGEIVRRVHVYLRKWDLAPATYETVKFL